ncbi:hypothetical protein V5F72_21030 [Xanthobacter flavus]|uniref:hypothetical protein n=1 Tax=Xanthobacter flavus TaxID=281 RepID=UPI00372649B9
MAETDENQIIAPEVPVPEEVAPAVEAPAPEEVATTVEAPAPETAIPVQLLRLVPTVGEPDMNDPRLDGAAIVEAALARQAADEA